MSEDIKLVGNGAVARIDGELDSTDGNSKLHTYIWTPSADAGEVRGVVQIIHGMAEHTARYEDFACELCGHGYIVAGLDHCGHGLSVSDPEQLGHLPMKKGADILVNDAHNFSLILRGAYPDAPFFLFGHSMGSFVTRRFVTDFPEGLAGAVISGTGQQPVPLSLSGNMLCRVLGKRFGETHRSALVDGMAAGGYAKGIKDARTPVDWLSYNVENVDKYIADPLCGFMFSVGGYEAVTNLTAEIATTSHAKEIPADMPLFFVSGIDDPVGDCGKGVVAAVKMYREAGVRDVDMILYPGMRHEILNEDDKAKVYVDVLNWLEDHRVK